ncbi:MAG TPA: peptidylprolyl isomerase [Casimicrobiaceae bacterium]|jgi:peptidyl-prolyl cis-trans isomerase SurA|nr:peptidylprolyl isomerase [Casimicrobiaceae bacterium]
MSVRIFIFAALALASAVVSAQNTSPARATAPQRSVTLDRVIAVVNDEAITQYELDDARRIVLQQLKQQKVQLPDADVLDRQVLERLITERALLQFAKENGIKVDDTMVDRAIQRIAEDNKLTPDGLRQALAKDNVPYSKYREDVRNEIVMQRLREREVEQQITVSDAEVDNYLATVKAQTGGEAEYLLAHILVLIPEQASSEQIEAKRRRAEDALKSIVGGAEFSQVAAGYSDAGDALSGGNLGWRPGARLPTIFAETVRGMKVGDVSPVLRSAAGFHIVKLLDRRSHNEPAMVDQTHARHILIRVNEVTSEADAKAKIDRLRDRLEAGAKFDEMAKLNSEDATSAKGGDLGWISPGDTVPAFEDAMNKLAINQLSAPVRTPFGWHLIEVLGRRKQDVTINRERTQAQLAIRQRKSDEAFQDWVRQTRDRAYVEVRLDER